MSKILLTGAFQYTKEQIEIIEKLGFEVSFVQDEKKRIKYDVSDIEVVVCNSLFLYNDINNFEKLKLIQLTSAGMDRTPLDIINKRGIKIFNAKDIYSVPMAEWVILKILEIYKKSKLFFYNQENHVWNKQKDLLELTQKTVSIIGYGSVGKEIAKRIKAFGVKIIAVDKKQVNSNYIDESLLISDLSSVLMESDVIILTLPLNKETKHLINRDAIISMKNNAVIINVARGEIIDEKALIEALKEKKFLGVALDVFKNEPLGKSPLWSFENVIITPHNSFVSDRVNDRLFNLILKNLHYFNQNF